MCFEVEWGGMGVVVEVFGVVCVVVYDIECVIYWYYCVFVVNDVSVFVKVSE